MSKPVINDEVEDVLSSIRRLVSENKRPLAGLRNTAPPSEMGDRAATDAAPDKLVLTPALRVAQSPHAAGDEEEGDRPLDLGAVALHSTSAATHSRETETTVRSEASADPDAGDADEGDGFWPGAASRYAVDEDPRDDDADFPVEQIRHLDSDWAESFVEEDGEGFVPAPEADMSEDEPEAELEPGTDPEPGPEEDELLAPEMVAETPAGADHAPAQEVPSRAERFDSALTAKIAALETAIGSIKQDFEPDGDEAETIAPSEMPPMAWEDDVELDPHGAPRNTDAQADADVEEGANEAEDRFAEDSFAEESTAEESAAEERAAEERAAEENAANSSDRLHLDDQVMDEEALRDLIGEIVRAELQGTLGERITRNVRKLVRREIHRALTTQELE